MEGIGLFGMMLHCLMPEAQLSNYLSYDAQNMPVWMELTCAAHT